MKRVRSVLGAFAALAVVASTLLVAAPAAFAGNTVFVNGTSIQAAVNAAAPGTTIIVSPGIYHESVVITKNGIHIRGAFNQPNPVLDSSTVDPDSGCGAFSGDPLDGFCIFPPTGPFTSPPITNIEIDHFTIQHFPGNGIIAFSAVGLNFHDNTVTDSGEYGIARFDSSQTQIVNNTVNGGDEAGIYVGDSPNASTLVRRNTVTNAGLGIFLRDSAHGTVTENTVTGNCYGILLVDTHPSSDVFDWTLVHNTANANNAACPAGDGPPTSGGGIVIAGARNSRFTANTTDNNVPSGPSIGSGGIVVLGTNTPPLSVNPSFLQIDNNHATGNSPFDLNWDGSGTSIVFFKNTCTTSNPGGLC